MKFKRFMLQAVEVVRERDGKSKSVRQVLTAEGDCGAMKIVILITVIESFAVTLAILYFYYRRSVSAIVVPKSKRESQISKIKK